MAAAIACIGFAVTRTSGVAPNWSMAPLAAAVVCWCWSFLAGIRNRKTFQNAMHMNAQLLRILAGEDPIAGPWPQQRRMAAEIVGQQMGQENIVASSSSNRQLVLLLVG